MVSKQPESRQSDPLLIEPIELGELPYLYGMPKSEADLRSQVEDFKVFELLPFTACGEGEHLIIHIRKTGANTVFVARQLAKYFQVKEALVSYAGLKDRNAVTEQYFGVHVPGKKQYDLSDLVIEGVEVLSYARHNKKLKNGALTGNRFEITLRNVTDVADMEQRWQDIVENGVPNYFGEQRFGIEGQNLTAAQQLFAGKKIKDKKKRGFYLSAARSFLFNQVVAQRIRQNVFSVPLAGDVFMLAGSRSVFATEQIDEDIIRRLKEQDIDMTAPLWGAGELMTTQQASLMENHVTQPYDSFTKGLGKFGLKQERRNITLRLMAGKFEASDDLVTVSFFLPAGSFATTILRELVCYQDKTVRDEPKSQ